MRRRQGERNYPRMREFQVAGFALKVPPLMPSCSPLCCLSVSFVLCSLQTATPCASSAWPTCGTLAVCACSARIPVTCSWGITACQTVLWDIMPTMAPAKVSTPYTHLEQLQGTAQILGRSSMKWFLFGREALSSWQDTALEEVFYFLAGRSFSGYFSA